MRDKRGQGLSVNAIILIVLGVVVLAVLVVGFTMGWEKLAPWMSTSNVDNIATACEVACFTNSVYNYCSEKRELKADDETLKDVTCYYLSEKEIKYGIGKCSSICSDVILSDCEDVDTGKISQVLNPTTKTLIHKTCE